MTPNDVDTADHGPVRGDRAGVGFLLNQAARAVRAQLAAELRLHNLDDMDFIVLRNAAAGGERGVTPGEVASDLNLPVKNVADRAQRLVTNGWLAQNGARSGAFVMTPRAQAVMPGLADTARWTLEQALNGFSRDEIEALSGMLERIIGNSGASR